MRTSWAILMVAGLWLGGCKTASYPTGTTAANQPAMELQRAQPQAPAKAASDSERKIIHTADLELETGNPEVAFKQVTQLVESKRGYVVTSESFVDGPTDQPERKMYVLSVRVESKQFDTTLEAIRKLGTRVLRDRRTGQDVTEEYIDLQARLKSQQALEQQFLQIAKQARKVSEVLEVQRELAEVRTRIEQLEGRRRFLANQAELATINLTLRPPIQVLTQTDGWADQIKRAINDGLQMLGALLLGLLRLAVVLVPIGLLLVWPLAWLLRLRKRRRVQAS